MAPKFAVYVRRSRKDELKPGEQETSTEQQLRLCMDYAARQGWTVPEQYVFDEGSGVSASDFGNGPRDKFDAMVETLERRAVDGLLLWKLDRASRNSRDTARLAELHDEGTQVASVVEGSMTGMMLEWMGLVAKQQARDISVNARRGKASLARKGLPSGGGRRRFGFEPDQVTVREPEAELIREAADRILKGQGTTTICRDWNRRGLRMPGGSLWTATPLRRVLLQPRTAGLRQQRTCQRKERKGGHRHAQRSWQERKGCWTIAGKATWPAIIDEATWNRLETVLRDPVRRSPGHPHEWLLSGIPMCGKCRESVLQGRRKLIDGTKTLVYECRPKIRGGCNGVSIDGADLDAYVTRATLDWLAGDGLMRAREQLASREADAEAVRAQLDRDEAKLAALADAYAAEDSTLDLPSMLRARKPIEQRIAKARERLRSVPRLAVVADLPATRKALTRAWKKMPVASKRAILRAVIGDFLVLSAAPGARTVEARTVLMFIDRERVRPRRLLGGPAALDATERKVLAKAGAELPHETDPSVLDTVARAIEEES